MSDFRKQILEDIEDFREKYPNINNIEKDEWAFNAWVLDKLFSVEEELIEEKIVDYNDKCVDCFVWHEDLHDLYLLQNKYYSDDTKVTNDYIQNDFLARPIAALENGTYTRSSVLQGIYDKYHEEEDFNIHLYMYVTNNTSKTQAIVDGISTFNKKNASKGIEAKFYSLDDIKDLYYGKPIVDKATFSYEISTINKGTTLNVNNDDYGTKLPLDAKYILAPVEVIYRMCKEAFNKKYPLFDENIREYLGSSGSVNKKIVATLKDEVDRNNFFFYNNGITMIVEKINKVNKVGVFTFEVTNPQIVNGCQTVSTIFETLDSLPESTIAEDFKNSFVMIKVLIIPSEDDSLKELYKNIVRYNNSQNSIDEKTFAAVKATFQRVQSGFEQDAGLLVCIKQSDKNTFLTKYKTATSLINKNKKYVDLFGLEGLSKTKDFIIPLEKLLQIILAFDNSPSDAIQNKSKLLIEGSEQNKRVLSFIESTDSTVMDLIYLYLLYLRAENKRKTSDDNKTPNPFYFIYCFAHYECNDNPAMIKQKLGSKELINGVVSRLTLTFKYYYNEWTSSNEGKEYNDMIKSAVDKTLLDKSYQSAKDAVAILC